LERGVKESAMKSLLLALPVAVAMSLMACSNSATNAGTAAPVVSSAPAPASGTPAPDVEKAITQLERDWVAAIVKKDDVSVERLLANDFVGTSPTAHTFNRTAALQDLKSGKYVVDAMELDEISVNTYGDVAVAFTSQNEKSRYADADTSGHYHFTDVWVKRNGAWNVVASHGTAYAGGHSKNEPRP
jgi:ketosteroid isomerase-like protein